MLFFAGRVLKVDGAHVAVRFPCTKDSKEIKDLTADDTVNLLQDCRLMRKDELQVSDYVCQASIIEAVFHNKQPMEIERSLFE